MAETIDIWFVRTAELETELSAKTFDRLLLAEEKTKRDRFVFERHQNEYVVTRAMMRLVLATYVDSVVVDDDPMRLVFERNAYGRPKLAGDLGHHLRFNLANSVDFVVCGVIRGDREIGIDTEPLRRGEEVLGVAEAVFTVRERALLEEKIETPHLRERAAVRLWTLKEAYMKARGLGMSLPADQFEMTLVNEEGATMDPVNARVVNDPEPSAWLFQTHQIDEQLVSTCIKKRAGETAPIVRIQNADLRELAQRFSRALR